MVDCAEYFYCSNVNTPNENYLFEKIMKDIDSNYPNLSDQDKKKSWYKNVNKIIKFGNPQFGKIKLRVDEIKSLYPSINKTRKLLKWKPTVGFLSGIKKTIKYYKSSLKFN